MLDRTNGMTLIALVITIIVMLILVAVTITMAVNGGLFEYAGKAVDETKNAINAEQQLANGKIKIGGKWYASIDDYINNNPIKSGIEIDLTEITLKKKEAEDVEGEEVLTQNITASVFGMESEPKISWEITPSDQTAITLSATTGKNITITAVGTEETTVTLTAKCTYEGEEYEETRDVTLEIIKKPVEVARGDFVYYDVEYTDVYYDTYTYTNTNGWRLLHYDTDENGNLYNVELISTGVPAKLFYNYSDTSTNKNWWVTTESSDDGTEPNLTDFKKVLGGDDNYVFYSGTLSNYEGLQASAGMYYNFGDIKFAYGTSSRGNNLGFFTAITVNDGTSEITYNANINNTVEKTGNDLFKVGNNAESVRVLTLREVNETVGTDKTDYDNISGIIASNDSMCLYRLDNLYKVTGMSDYSYSNSNSGYWLASPCPGTGVEIYLCSLLCNGYIRGSQVNSGGNTYAYDYGVRPVIQFKTDTHYTVESKIDDSGIEYLILTPVV